MEQNVQKLSNFYKKKILVVGDLVLDQYVGGTVDRISPEAPVPVLNVIWSEDRLGCAGNVANNITSLGGTARLFACIGNDQSGKIIENILNNLGIDSTFIIKKDDIKTIKKVRIIAKNQQIVRLDYEEKKDVSIHLFNYAKTNIKSLFDGIDACILSDYNKGSINSNISQLIINEGKKRNIPVLVDPKGNNWDKYKEATICTPNMIEFADVCHSSVSKLTEDNIYSLAIELCKKYCIPNICLTRSEKGMSVITINGEKFDVPALRKEVVDVSGAGDTVISTMALSIATGMSIADACVLSNSAASIAVSKLGTTPVQYQELEDLISEHNGKVRSLEEIEIITDRIRKRKNRIVFTNGCFDLLHAGHVSMLEKAKSFGDVLIVGLNSDDSVRRLKGNDRPIINQNDRAKVLQSLHSVDYVVIFDEDTPERIIKIIKPDVLVKGKDYLGKHIAGEEFVKENGGNVALIDLEAGRSTTNIIGIIKKEDKDN